jgi:type I restriction enzyme, S subunit
MNVEFSNNTVSVELSELFEYVIGGDWGKDLEYKDDNFGIACCIRGSEFKNWDEDKGKTASLRKIKIGSIASRKLQEGDILIEISGGGPEQPVGRTVLIEKSVFSYKPEVPKICTNFLRLARPTKHINPKYLNLFLNFFYKSGDVIQYQGGSNNLRNLKFDEFCTIQVPIVPLPEQQRIVARIEELFSSLDKGIESLKTAQQQLKVYRQAVLKWAFEGKLTNKNVVDGGLPEGWKWKQIKEITSILGDGLHGTPIYSENGDYFFINGNNLSDRKIEIKENTKRVTIEEYEKYKKPLNENTIFVSINGTLGNTAFYNREKVILGKSACYFNVLNKVDKQYVRYSITSQRFINYAHKNATGSTIKNVGLKAMREFEIPLPPTIEEQQLIVAEIESRLSVCDKVEETIEQSLKQAEVLRQSILKKAFEGKLVPQDPSDEPASVLLERIRKERAETLPSMLQKGRRK